MRTDIDERTMKIWKSVWETANTQSDLKENELTETMLRELFGLSRATTRTRIIKLISAGKIIRREGAYHNGKRCSAYSIVQSDEATG